MYKQVISFKYQRQGNKQIKLGANWVHYISHTWASDVTANLSGCHLYWSVWNVWVKVIALEIYWVIDLFCVNSKLWVD